MLEYRNMLRRILNEGQDRQDRTGVGTRSLFGFHTTYKNIGRDFPLDTRRALNFSNVVHELLWFLSGDTNIRYLVQNGCYFWTDWPLKNYNQQNPTFTMDRKEFHRCIIENEEFAAQWGDCGPIYGKQWRAWDGEPQQGNFFESTDEWDTVQKANDGIWTESSPTAYRLKPIDQISNLVADLKKNPYSRRHILSAWNVADIPAMIPSGLPPCHCLVQFYCREMTPLQRRDYQDKHLEIKTVGGCVHLNPYFEGEVPYSSLSLEDIALAHKDIERWNKYTPRFYLDCQLYQRSADSVLGVPINIACYSLLTMMLAQQVNMVAGHFHHTVGDAHIYHNHIETLQEQMQRPERLTPQVQIKKAADIFSYTIDDFTLEGYDPHPAITYKIAV